jgi:hypothetical protein
VAETLVAGVPDDAADDEVYGARIELFGGAVAVDSVGFVAGAEHPSARKTIGSKTAGLSQHLVLSAYEFLWEAWLGDGLCMGCSVRAACLSGFVNCAARGRKCQGMRIGVKSSCGMCRKSRAAHVAAKRRRNASNSYIFLFSCILSAGR